MSTVTAMTTMALITVEVETLKDTLPNLVVSIREEAYEHLDTMWADTAKDTVFPKVPFSELYVFVCVGGTGVEAFRLMGFCLLFFLYRSMHDFSLYFYLPLGV